MKKQKIYSYLRILLFLSLVPGIYLLLEWGGAEKITEAVRPPSEINAVRIGSPAQNFTVTEDKVWTKQSFEFGKLKGYPVVMHFWATWCGPCLTELPELLKLADKLRPQGISVVAVAIDQSWSDIDNFFGQHPELKVMPEKMVLLLDPDSRIANLYGSSRFPETFLINDAMVIDNKFVGAQDWMNPRMDEYFRPLRTLK
jgi:cytochrome c biogenesis protein CcmG/thiol:disulfide interchange protein DsbE